MAIPGNKDLRDGILFSLPFMIVFTVLMIFPLGFGLFISFFKWDILSTREFVGLANYITMFKDEVFFSSLWHTVQFVLITTPVLLVVGFLMALLVTSKSPLRIIAENVFFIPYILSMTVVSTLWAWMMQRNYGLFNQILTSLGSTPIGWLTDPNLAIWSVCLATIWWTAGFNMILFSAAIKQISKEIYESAQMDGANYRQVLFNITVPLVKPTTVLCLILQVIASFNVFGQVYVMTGGGPYGTTRVLIQYVYETGFKYYKMGYSAAMSYVLFLIILVISVVQYIALGRKES
ncbi:carbohydrate ABC transporter permease [Breznakiella homolactica]|uniref:Sugar ABC transporter permease n=1 Tax=Breznakiella homolactica TaxID=2798577 RepID=A0A7T7XMM7_9SPIR|nr:sugar ABC transporter permease [Breznakiella homolactica]QQO09068.1 sugar ABC transporter permease [Breznakiella homolactica]